MNTRPVEETAPTHLTLRDYDASRRVDAQRAGRPLVRSAMPGMFLSNPAGFLVTVRNGRPVVRDVGADYDETTPWIGAGDSAVAVPDVGAERPLTAVEAVNLVKQAYAQDASMPSRDRGAPRWLQPSGAVANARREGGRSILFSNHVAFRTVRAMVRKANARGTLGPEGREVERMLEYRDSLPHSGHMPFLTQSLQDKYWLPAGMNADSLAAWAEAFGKGDAPTGVKLAHLLSKAAHGTVRNGTANLMIGSEWWGTLGAKYRSDSSKIKAFRRAEIVASAWNAMRDEDRRLVDRNVIDGAATTMNVIGMTPVMGTVTIDTRFKVKEGAILRAYRADDDSDRPRGASFRVARITVDEATRSMYADLERANTKARSMPLLARTYAEDATLIGVVEPYLGGGGGAGSSGRWNGSTLPEDGRPARREVPVDVALAGSPESA